jgi:hypothetical protein
MARVMGNAMNVRIVPTLRIQNTYYCECWRQAMAVEVPSGEAEGIKDCLFCFGRKKFYEVLFPEEDIIIFFWETFWLVYSTDLI